MYSVPGDTTSLVPGFPIRTSSDQRSVDSSPRHIAASHVLHRLPVPRHPPCALKHLQHKKPKIENHKKLHHNKPHTTRTTTTPERATTTRAIMRSDARNHYPQIKHHTPPPRWSDNTNPHTPTPQKKGGDHPGAGTHPTRRARGPVVSGPNSVSGDTRSTHPKRSRPRPGQRLVHRAPEPDPLQTRPIQRIRSKTGNPALCGPARTSWCSLERR